MSKLKTKTYCTCVGGKTNNTKFYEVEVNNEGICNNCGYYAVSQYDCPNVHGGLNKVTKEVIIPLMERNNNNTARVANIVGVNKKRIREILGKQLTNILNSAKMI